MADALIAIDVGGTKLAAGVVSPRGEVVARARRSTPPVRDGEAIYSTLLEVVTEAIQQAGEGWSLQGVGVGSGGPMNLREGLVSPLNMPGWRDFPLVARLRADLRLPVVLDNDAKAFALGEYLFGAGQGHPDMMGVVVSTGVGGGVITSGRLLHGRTQNAGHVGHQVAEPDGPRCLCGGYGCVEAIASGPSIVRLLRAQLDQGRASVLRDIPGDRLSAQMVAEAARDGDALAIESFERAGRALGVGFGGAAALLDIDLIVLGGGVSHAGDLLLVPLRETLSRHSGLEYIRGQLQVVPSHNALDAGLVGAAALALHDSPAPAA